MRWYRGKLRQTMVDSWLCPIRVVPEGTSQDSRRSEVGNHKQRTLNTWLSPGTSAEIFACPAGPWRNYEAETGTKPHRYFEPDPKKESEQNRSFLSFFLGFRRPTLITGLSGWRTPNQPLRTQEPIPDRRTGALPSLW